MNTFRNALTVLALAAAITFAFLWNSQRQAMEVLRVESESLHKDAARAVSLEEELNSQRRKHAALASQLVDPKEVAKLRADAAELRRTKDELTRAQAAAKSAQQQLAAQAAVATAQAAQQAQAQPAAPAEPPFTFNANVALNTGETLVGGGWSMEPGKRTYAFVTPQVNADGTISINAQLLSLPESALAAAGLAEILASSNQSDRYGITTQRNTRVVMANVKQIPGAEMLSSPRVVTQPGQQAQVQVGNGIALNFQPTLQPGGSGVNLNMSASLSPNQTSRP